MLVEDLRYIIKNTKDRQALLSSVARRRSNPDLKRTLNRIASQRESHAERLQREANGLGAEAEETGSVGGVLRRALINMKKTFFGQDLGDDLNQCMVSEYLALKDLSNLLRRSLPSGLEEALRAQFEETRETLDALRQLKRRYAKQILPVTEERVSEANGAGLSLDCHGLTDRGRIRERNEDHYLLADLTKSLSIHSTSLALSEHTRWFSSAEGHLFLVADGIGGHEGGERASALVVDTVARYVLNMMPWFLRLRNDGEERLLRNELGHIIENCQWTLASDVREDTGKAGMGTTLTIAYMVWPDLYVIHIGDSRCYLKRGDHLEQVTTDHTIGQRLVDAGALEPDKLSKSRWSHVLWKSLGASSQDAKPDVYHVGLEVGDTVLLCTDGLTNEVDDATIQTILDEEDSATANAKKLVGLANENGGADNITVVVARSSFVNSESEDSAL